LRCAETAFESSSSDADSHSDKCRTIRSRIGLATASNHPA
jgi:hypothetical protein